MPSKVSLMWCLRSLYPMRRIVKKILESEKAMYLSPLPAVWAKYDPHSHTWGRQAHSLPVRTYTYMLHTLKHYHQSKATLRLPIHRKSRIIWQFMDDFGLNCSNPRVWFFSSAEGNRHQGLWKCVIRWHGKHSPSTVDHAWQGEGATATYAEHHLQYGWPLIRVSYPKDPSRWKNVEGEKGTAFLLEAGLGLTVQRESHGVCPQPLPALVAPCRTLVLPSFCFFVNGFIRNLNSPYVHNKFPK